MAAKPRRGSRHDDAQSSDRPAPLFRAYLGISLDGYIADRDGGVEWLERYITPEQDFAAFFRSIGATVMGRRSYDWIVEHAYALETEGPVIVQTHRPLLEPRAAARGGRGTRGRAREASLGRGRFEAFDGDVRELAARLREELGGTGKDVYLFGGGESIASFHEHGLVDRWELGIVPALLGEGIPLFPRHSRGLDALRLTRSRVLRNGLIEACYEPSK